MIAPASLPPEAPMAMPVQRLNGTAPAMNEVTTRPQGLVIKRLLLLAFTAVLGLAGSSEVRLAFSQRGLGPFDLALMVCFMPLFSWIGFGFMASLIGFFQLISGEHPGFAEIPQPASTLRHRSAVLMPVYHENVEDVFARVGVMADAIAATGAAAWIDFFILSDSNSSHGKAEVAAWRQVSATAPIAVYYRRRTENIARKPGNIAEWVRRFGAAYENMLVLDADSMMSGKAIVGMAAIMEARPSVGLLQTVPMIAQARTPFQRWMRFANEAYGPIASAGLLWWSGSEANYWGHNAIIRTRAFAESCGLPELPGNPPFGGYIQSHDMVESALLRRRGWAVHMIMIRGSYEEFPPTMIDFALRDQRWMQGNLQHLRLLAAAGFSGTSRLHLLLGAVAYLASPVWLLLLLVSILRAWFTRNSLPSVWMPAPVLAMTVVLLFAPKVMGALWLISEPQRRQNFGGAWTIVRSVMLEAGLSILMAPVTMVTQTRALLRMVLGIQSGWSAQDREAHHIPVRSILPLLHEHLALGAIFAATALFDKELALWLLPLTVGLLTSPWLISLTSSEALEEAPDRAGLFRVPAPEIAAKGGWPNTASADDEP